MTTYSRACEYNMRSFFHDTEPVRLLLIEHIVNWRYHGCSFFLARTQGMLKKNKHNFWKEHLVQFQTNALAAFVCDNGFLTDYWKQEPDLEKALSTNGQFQKISNMKANKLCRFFLKKKHNGSPEHKTSSEKCTSTFLWFKYIAQECHKLWRGMVNFFVNCLLSQY